MGKKLANLENPELFAKIFSLPLFTDTLKMYLAYALIVTLPIPHQYLLPVSFTKIFPYQDSPAYGTCTCT